MKYMKVDIKENIVSYEICETFREAQYSTTHF